MWLLGNAWKFLRQIWCDCLAGLCSLMGWFWLKLLHVYEIGIMPNFKFGFCNYTWNPCGYPHRYVCYVMLHSEQLLPNLLKRWKLSSEKLISKRIRVRGSLKVVIYCRPKQHAQLRKLNASQTNNGMRDSMHASAVCAIFGLLLPVLSLVTDRAHQYIYVSVLWSSTCSFFQ